MVSIRRFKLNPKVSPENLPQYLDLISKLRHRHLVRVLGHCIVISQDSVNTTTGIYLVSEHVTNGTLRSHLTGTRTLQLSRPLCVAIEGDNIIFPLFFLVQSGESARC